MDMVCLNDMELDAVSGGHGRGHGRGPRPFETEYEFNGPITITNNGTVNGVNGIANGGQTFNFS